MYARIRRVLTAIERAVCDIAPAHPAVSRTALWWAHSGPTSRSRFAGAGITALALLLPPFGIVYAATLWLVLIEAERVSAAVHLLADEEGVWCAQCHRHDDDSGPGGTHPQPQPTDGPLDPFTADQVDVVCDLYLLELVS